MQLTVVKGLPKIKRAQINVEELKEQLHEFDISEAKVVRIDYSINEFGNPHSVYNTMRRYLKELGYSMRVVPAGKDVYLEKY